MESLTDLPGGKDKSRMILLPEPSFFGTELRGDKMNGFEKGLVVNGPRTVRPMVSSARYTEISDLKLVAPVWFLVIGRGDSMGPASIGHPNWQRDTTCLSWYSDTCLALGCLSAKELEFYIAESCISSSL